MGPVPISRFQSCSYRLPGDASARCMQRAHPLYLRYKVEKRVDELRSYLEAVANIAELLCISSLETAVP
jgi:hypothetical protein